MNLTRVFSIVTLIIAIGLAYFLVDSIKYSIEEEERIKRAEARVINKLKMIREAQKAYQNVNGKFTSDWDSLIAFIDSGEFFIVERIETIITLDYGADSLHVEVDTIGKVPVKDSIFKQDRYPSFKAEALPYIPGTDGKKFDLWADRITRGGIRVDVIEVKDVAPVNPSRREEAELQSKKPLRFGSKTEVTTSGNWE